MSETFSWLKVITGCNTAVDIMCFHWFLRLVFLKWEKHVMLWVSGHFEHMKWFQVIDLPQNPNRIQKASWGKTRHDSSIWKGYLKYTDKRKAQKSLLSFTNACASLHHVVLEQSLSFFLAGIRSWDVDLKCCDLDQQLQLFITRHSAHFSSEVRGQCDVALYEPGDDLTETSNVFWITF